MLFQWLLIAFAVFALLRTYRQYKRQRVSLSWLFLWLCLWVAVIAVALRPDATDVVARFLGVERGADLIVYSGVVVLAYALWRTMIRQEELHRKLTTLVRKLAMLEAKKSEEQKNR